MNRKQSLIFFTVGAFFTLILGTAGHFFYEWSGKNPVVGLFFPINESVWEHMKLVLFPTALYLGTASLKVRGGNYALSSFVALFVGAALIPLLFYSYTGIVGKSVLAADITVFIVSVIAGYAFAYLLFNIKRLPFLNAVAVIGIAAIVVCFFTFTLCPPDAELFQSP